MGGARESFHKATVSKSQPLARVEARPKETSADCCPARPANSRTNSSSRKSLSAIEPSIQAPVNRREDWNANSLLPAMGLSAESDDFDPAINRASALLYLSL